jgi:hypothetical protein
MKRTDRCQAFRGRHKGLGYDGPAIPKPEPVTVNGVEIMQPLPPIRFVPAAGTY